MTRDMDVDQLLRTYLADEGRRVEEAAQSLESVAGSLAERVADTLNRSDRRLILLLVAAMLAALLAASTIAIGRGLLPVPTVIEPAPTEEAVVAGGGVIVFADGHLLRVRDLSEDRSRIAFVNDASVAGLRVSPDGSRVALMTIDASGEDLRDLTALWVANLDGSKRERVAEGRSAARAIEWSPDGRRLAVLTGRQRLTIVDVDAPESATEWEFAAIQSGAELRWHPSGEEVFVFDEGSLSVHAVSVKTWDIREVMPPADAQRGPGLDTLSLSEDGALLAVSLRDEVRITNVASGSTWTWKAGGDLVASALAPNGARLAAVVHDRLLIATIDGDVIHELDFGSATQPGVPLQVANLAFAPDSASVLVAPGRQPRAWLVDLQSGEAVEFDWGIEGGQLARWQPQP